MAPAPTKYKGRPVRPPLETKEEQKFVKWAKAQGCLCRKLNGGGQRDWPDQLVLIPGGAMLLMEFKREGKPLRPSQEEWHRLAKAGGHDPYTVWSAQEAIELVECYLEH